MKAGSIKLYYPNLWEDQAMTDEQNDWPPPFELMKLQARGPLTGNWIDIYPAQLEQMLKQGLDIRVIEPPAPQALAATPAVGGEARKWIIDLIHNEYDPKPSDYRPGDNWNDGAEEIADQILERLRNV